MANLKELRGRIRSVKNTQQITKAMKMVAAAKLRRSQERVQAGRPYSQRMGRMIQSIAARVSGDSASPLLAGRRGEANKVELVVYTADRGLCGSFNSSVVRAVRAKIPELQEQGFEVSITCIGRKANDVLKRQYAGLIRQVHTGFGRDLTFARVQETVAIPLLADFDNEVFDVCIMVYNEFQSAMTQNLTWRQIIPMQVDTGDDDEDGEEETSGPPLYEPEEEELLAAILPQNIHIQLYQALLESDASEHGARMTAMDNAVRNAGDMLRRLNITYNRTRQAAITTELMEIIGGAESLKG